MEMEITNNREKQELEDNLNSVIHNSKSHLAAQQQQFTALQTKLASQLTKYQNKVLQQQKEITTLKRTVEAMEKMGKGERATEDEIEQMQTVLDAWQNQATTAHEELKKTSSKLKELTGTHQSTLKENEGLRSKLSAHLTLGNIRDVGGSIEELTSDLTTLTSTRDNMEREVKEIKADIVLAKSASKELDRAREAAAAVYGDKKNRALNEKNGIIKRQQEEVDRLKSDLAAKNKTIVGSNDEVRGGERSAREDNIYY